jgi:hypothetical protein
MPHVRSLQLWTVLFFQVVRGVRLLRSIIAGKKRSTLKPMTSRDMTKCLGIVYSKRGGDGRTDKVGCTGLAFGRWVGDCLIGP